MNTNEPLLITNKDTLPDAELRITRTRKGETWELGDHRLHVGAFSVASMKASEFETETFSIIVDVPPRISFPFDDLRLMEDIKSLSVFCDVRAMALFFLEFGIGIQNVLCWHKPVVVDENRETYDPDISYLLWIPLWDRWELIQSRDKQPYANRSQVLTSFSKTMHGMSTEKPLDLFENQMSLVSKPGEVILDPMAQGVSILHACMRMDRVGLLMAEDPVSADKILNWYEKETRESVRRCDP